MGNRLVCDQSNAEVVFTQLCERSVFLPAIIAVVVIAVFLRRILKSALYAHKVPTKLLQLLSLGLPLVLNGIAFWGLT